MGSFNTSCAVSSLPIKMGDEVKLFILVGHKPADRNMLYPNHLFDIVGLPFNAVYDDYGRYTLDETEYNSEVWEIHRRWLAENLIPVPAGERSRDEEVDPQNIDFVHLQNMIWENRIKIRHQLLEDMEIENLPLAIYAVHKDLYETLNKSFDTWDGIFSTEEKVKVIQEDPLYPFLVDHVNFMATWVDDEEAEDEATENARDAHAMIRLYERIKDLRPEPIIFHKNNIHLSNDGIIKTIPMELDEYMKHVRAIIETHVFCVNLNVLNITILPGMTSGQTYFYPKHLAFHEAVLELAKEKQSKCEDWER